MMNAQDPATRPQTIALGQVVRDRRKFLRMSQDALAAECGCNRQSINRIEGAKFQPLFGRLVLLAHALGWSLTELAAAIDTRVEENALPADRAAVGQ